MRPIACPGCIYSGQSHLETCEHSSSDLYRRRLATSEECRDNLAKALEKHTVATALIGNILSLTLDEVWIVAQYVSRLIESRPKESKS